ncbi:hypothetical protein Xoosp14_235 [Xanthomonas phage Xoo-sp14]|nr:hypothetical protein Xoosp14_235 [Xanthomonas phage Xoo-sp14]
MPVSNKNRKNTNARKPYKAGRDRDLTAQSLRELEDVYSGCAQQLAQVLPVSNILRSKEALEQVPVEDRTELVKVAQVVSQDSRTFRTELDGIRKGHVEFSNTVTARVRKTSKPRMTGDETMQVIDIAEKYADWQGRHTRIVMPNIVQTLGYYDQETREELKADKAAEEAVAAPIEETSHQENEQ